ncbi:hypothetical protein LBMAG27_01590 [Bacteroidota bacterium]|nr:hypothetical protein LBMAG27_01590 [Bacteroidota bacterium]
MKTTKKAPVKKVAAKKPEAKKVAVKKALAKKEATKKPEAKKTEVKKAVINKVASKKQEIKKVEAKKSDVKKAEPKKPAVQKEEKKPAAPKPIKKTLTKKKEYKVAGPPAVPLATKISSSGKKLYTMEFVIKSSPVILYDFVTATSNMAQWFADEVDRSRDDLYTFTWDGNSQAAIVLDEIEHELVRYQWVDGPKDEYFEFKVTHTEITGDTVLIITDFALPNDMKDAQFLWDSQIKNMIQQLGA